MLSCWQIVRLFVWEKAEKKKKREERKAPNTLVSTLPINLGQAEGPLPDFVVAAQNGAQQRQRQIELIGNFKVVVQSRNRLVVVMMMANMNQKLQLLPQLIKVVIDFEGAKEN